MLLRALGRPEGAFESETLSFFLFIFFLLFFLNLYPSLFFMCVGHLPWCMYFRRSALLHMCGSPAMANA